MEIGKEIKVFGKSFKVDDYKAEIAAQDIMIFCDDNSAAVSKSEFQSKLKDLKNLSNKDLVNFIHKFDNNESIMELICDEVGSSKQDRKAACELVFGILAERAKSLGVDTKDFEEQFNKELKSQFNSWKPVDTEKLDKIVLAVTQSVENRQNFTKEDVKTIQKTSASEGQVQSNTALETRLEKAYASFGERVDENGNMSTKDKEGKYYDGQMQKDGWAADTADFVSKIWGSENTADKVRGDLKIAADQLQQLKEAKDQGEDAFKSKFKEIFGVEFDYANIYGYEKAEKTYLDAAPKHQVEMSFNNATKKLLSDAPLEDEYTYTTMNSMAGAYTTSTLAATKAQVYDREFKNLASLMGEKGTETLNQILEKNGVKDASVEEKFEVLKSVAKSCSQKLHSDTMEATGGKSFAAIKDVYDNSYKAAYGVENDIMKRVTDYNTSQDIGAGVVKAGATIVASVAAAATGFGLVGVAGITAGTTVLAEASDRGTSGKALNTLRDEGVVEYLKTANNDIDWAATLKQATISGGAVLIGGGVAKGVTVLMQGKSTVAQAAAMFGADVVTDAGMEYVTTGQISASGLIFTVLLSAAGNIVAAKQTGTLADAAQGADEAIDAAKVAGNATDVLQGADDAIDVAAAVTRDDAGISKLKKLKSSVSEFIDGQPAAKAGAAADAAAKITPKAEVDVKSKLASVGFTDDVIKEIKANCPLGAEGADAFTNGLLDMVVYLEDQVASGKSITRELIEEALDVCAPSGSGASTGVQRQLLANFWDKGDEVFNAYGQKAPGQSTFSVGNMKAKYNKVKQGISEYIDDFKFEHELGKYSPTPEMKIKRALADDVYAATAKAGSEADIAKLKQKYYQVIDKLAKMKASDGKNLFSADDIRTIMANCSEVIESNPQKIVHILDDWGERSFIADGKNPAARAVKAILEPSPRLIDENPLIMLGDKSPTTFMKPQAADNIKGKGISFKQAAGQPDYSATRIEWGDTVEQTIALNKKNGIDLEFVKGDDGKYFLGIKDVWSDGYHRVDRNSVVMHYGDFVPEKTSANKAWVKAHANSDGTIKDCAVVANDTGAKILENSYVTADGQKIDFATMAPGTKVHKDPDAIVNAVAFDAPKKLQTLEGQIETAVTMGDVDGNVYNNFKQLKKQITQGQLLADSSNPYSQQFIDLIKAGDDDAAIALLKKATAADAVKPGKKIIASTGNKCVLPKNMQHTSGKIGDVSVKVASGDMTSIKADAFLVPEFQRGASYGGVGAAVERNGAGAGLDAFDEIVRTQGEQPYGAVHITESGGGNSSKLIHAVTVGSGPENEFQVIQDAVYNSLKAAEEQGLSSVAMPALGTGIIGSMTNEQSAQAMMAAIKRFSDEGGKMDVSLVLYGSPKGYNAFADTMKSGNYTSVASQVGAKQFDTAGFLAGLANDGVDVDASLQAQKIASADAAKAVDAPTSVTPKASQASAVVAKQAATPNPHNLSFVDTPDEVGKFAQQALGTSDYRIATAGYSAAPNGYEIPTKKFMQALDAELGAKKTSYVTSPTADKGSIDAITTEIAGFDDGRLFYTTAKDYVEYINPDNFPAGFDKAKYATVPKYVLPDGASYSKATAEASNVFLATGGRNATVSDFVNALNKGNKTIVLDNTSLDVPAWDAAKNRVNNASKYLSDQIEAVKSGRPLPYPEIGEFTEDFIRSNLDKIESNMRIYQIDGTDASIAAAANESASFVKAQNSPLESVAAKAVDAPTTVLPKASSSPMSASVLDDLATEISEYRNLLNEQILSKSEAEILIKMCQDSANPISNFKEKIVAILRNSDEVDFLETHYKNKVAGMMERLENPMLSTIKKNPGLF